MKKQWIRYLVALLALSMFAVSCGGSDDESSSSSEETVSTDSSTTDTAPAEEVIEAGSQAEEQVDTEVVELEDTGNYGGSVVYGLEAEATGLRPWEDSCSSPCYNMSFAVFDKLIEFREDGTYGPWLATDFSANDDFSEWVINLRDGVTFHNGVEFNAQTVVDMYAIQLEGSQSAGQIAAAGIEAVKASGDLQVTYTLNRSNSAFPAYLERVPLGAVFEPGAALEMAEGFSITPVGTGPFVVETRDLDNETLMVRNDNYWMSDKDGNQLPYLDSIAFRPIPDETTRLDSLLSGTVNAMQTLRQGTIRDTRDSDDGLSLFEFQGNNVGGGMFNVAAPPFDDVRVRRGLTQMNNQDAVIGALGGTGISLPGTQWFSPDSVWYSEEAAAAWPTFDFEAGKATLQGYIDDPARSDGKAAGEPVDFELSCPPDPTLIAAMQVLEQLWTSSGMVDVNLTNFDQQTHINYALGAPPDFLGEHGAHCWRWSSDNDPSTELNRQFAPYSPGNAEENGLDPSLMSATNFFNYFDADIFGWLNDAIATDDFQTRYDLYEKVMIRLGETTPLWFSGHTATMIATEENVVGVNSWLLPDGTLGVGHPNAEGRWGQTFIQN